MKKHFLSSFPSTSLTAVASGKRNFSLTLISYRTFKKETKKQNKQTSKKDENCARNQTRFTTLEHSSMNKNNLAAWRHNHPPHKPRRKGKSKINDHCWSLCRMLFWISYNILSIALSSTTILSPPLTANSFLDIIFFLFVMHLLCIGSEEPIKCPSCDNWTWWQGSPEQLLVADTLVQKYNIFSFEPK